MGKSAKKSASKVSAGAVVAAPAPAPAKPLKKGKREAEAVRIEKELASPKKQKLVAGNNSEKKVVETKVESDKSEFESEQNPKAESVEEEALVAPAAQKKDESDGEVVAKAAEENDTKVESDKSESEQNPKAESMEEEAPEAPAAQKKDESDGGSDGEVVEKAAEENDVAVSDEEDDGSSDEEEEKAAEIANTIFVGNLPFDVKQADIEEFFKPAGNVVQVRLAMNHGDGSFRGFGHVEFATAAQAEKALRELNGEKLLQRALRLDHAHEKPNKKAGEEAVEKKEQPSVAAGSSKTLFVGNLFFGVEQAHLEGFFSSAGGVVDVFLAKKREDGSSRCFGYVEFASTEQAEKALLELNGKELLGRAVRLDRATEKTNKKAGDEAEGKKEQSTVGAGGSKTLFVGNLSFDVKQAHVEGFFSSAGGVVDVRLAKKLDDDSFRGYGHVEFATAEQAEKALRELNGKELLQRAVRIDLASERGGEGKDDSQRGSSKPEAVFVKGFDSSEGEDKIRSLLTAHFSPCGEIERISIPPGEDGKTKGHAFVQFIDAASRYRALALNGNNSLSVEELKLRGDSISGRGRGRGRSGFGGGGRGGRGRGGGRRGGRGNNNRYN